jgi:hypothetical protein
VSPQHVLGGRVRTSTLVLSALFLGVLALYIAVRPDPTAPARRGGSVVRPEPSPTPASPSASPEPTPRRTSSPTPTAVPSAVATPSVGASLPALPSATGAP